MDESAQTVKITTHIDDDLSVVQELNSMGLTIRDVTRVKTLQQEAAVRRALILLGWTPPHESP